MGIKKLAILGPTASGKTSLAINLAKKYQAVILSLDSLSIYKDIDIASAKPTLEERGDIPHFGIDEITPNELFSVKDFFKLYKKAYSFAKEHKKPLIIVGGSSFYLKAMLEGLSLKPKISPNTAKRVQRELLNIENAQNLANSIDKEFVKRVEKHDKYRLEKWLELFFETGEIPTLYQKRNKETPIIESIEIFEIEIDRGELRELLKIRTQKMLDDGLIKEIEYLIKTYSLSPSCQKAIGIKESIEYLEKKINLNTLFEKIVVNSARLAKRQQTFNKTQFKTNKTRAPLNALKRKIENYLTQYL